MKFKGFPRSVCAKFALGAAVSAAADPLLSVADPLAALASPLSGLLGGGGGPGGSATLNPNQYNEQANSNSSYGTQAINSWSPGPTFQPQGFNPGYNNPISNNPGIQSTATSGYNPQSISAPASNNALSGFAQMAQTATGGGGPGMAVGSPFFNQSGGGNGAAPAMATVPNTGNSAVPQSGGNNLAEMLQRSQQPPQQQAPQSLGSPQQWGIPQNPPSANILTQYPNATAMVKSGQVPKGTHGTGLVPPPPATPYIASNLTTPPGIDPNEYEQFKQFQAMKAQQQQPNARQAQFNEQAAAQGLDDSPESMAAALVPGLMQKTTPTNLFAGISGPIDPELQKVAASRTNLENQYRQQLLTSHPDGRKEAEEQLKKATKLHNTIVGQATQYNEETHTFGTLTPGTLALIAKKAADLYDQYNPKTVDDSPVTPEEIYNRVSKTKHPLLRGAGELLGATRLPGAALARPLTTQKNARINYSLRRADQINDRNARFDNQALDDNRSGKQAAINAAIKEAREGLPEALKASQQYVKDSQFDLKQANENYNKVDKAAQLAAQRTIKQTMESDAFTAKKANQKFAQQHAKVMENLKREDQRLAGLRIDVATRNADVAQFRAETDDSRLENAEENTQLRREAQPWLIQQRQSNVYRNNMAAATQEKAGMDSGAANDPFKFPRPQFWGQEAPIELIRKYQNGTSNNEEARQYLIDNGWKIPQRK